MPAKRDGESSGASPLTKRGKGDDGVNDLEMEDEPAWANQFKKDMKEDMRYIVLSAAGCIEVRQQPMRPPGPGEVLVRVGAAGICGSDLHYFRHGGLGSFPAKMPMLIGHEVSGTVELVGSGDMHGLSLGMRVAVEPANACLACNLCGRGRFNLCAQGTFLGAEGSASGGMADVLVVPAHMCVPLPSTVSLRLGALLEPLSVGLYSCRVAQLQPQETFGVIGCGAIGLCILFCALKEGALNAWCVEPLPDRQALAKNYGAPVVKSPDDCGGLDKADVVFDVVGTDVSFTAALNYVAPGGRVALVGIPEQDHLLLNPHRARTKAITIFNVRRSNIPMGECLPLVADPKDALLIEQLATHTFNFSGAQRHFELASTYGQGVVRCLLEPSGTEALGGENRL